MERSADWLEQARGDLAHARNDLDAGFYDWACFSSQQAAEKATKAVIQRLGGNACGHSVADLLGSVRQNVAVPDSLIEAALDLDRAYIAARYPNAHPSGSPRSRYFRSEAQRLIGHAERVVQFCEGILSSP